MDQVTNNYPVSVVVPVYHTSEGLNTLVSRVHEALHDREHEIILVDDGSPLETWLAITELSKRERSVLGIRLGRNAGQHSALLAGVRHAKFPITVTLDDDLQNPPEEIPRLLEALTAGFDVVYGSPAAVAQRKWRAVAATAMRMFLTRSLGVESAGQMSSFRAFRTPLRDGFDSDLGPAVSLDALLAWSTSRFTSVTVAHHKRAEGTSNYSFRKLVRFAFDTATGYSAVPLQAAMMLGASAALFGLGVLAWVLGRLIVSGQSVPGFPFLASIVAIFSGTQLIALGVMGEYLARMHFRIMRKPTFVIAETTTYNELGSDGSNERESQF